VTTLLLLLAAFLSVAWTLTALAGLSDAIERSVS
jgi:hypothetical protein